MQSIPVGATGSFSLSDRRSDSSVKKSEAMRAFKIHGPSNLFAEKFLRFIHALLHCTILRFNVHRCYSVVPILHRAK